MIGEERLSIRPDFLTFFGGSGDTLRFPLMFSTNVVVSLNGGTPKSSIFMGFSILNHPFWGTFIFGNTNVVVKLTANIGDGGLVFYRESVALVNPPCWRMRM